MTDTSISTDSRRSRRSGSKGHGSTAIKGSPRFGLRAILLASILPVLLLVWGVSKTFLSLCADRCSYSNFSPAAEISMWIFFALSVACVFAVLYYASESLNAQEKKVKPIIATAITGLASGFFFSGAFQDIFSSIIIRMMY